MACADGRPDLALKPSDMDSFALPMYPSPAVASKACEARGGASPLMLKTDESTWALLGALRFFLAACVCFGHIGMATQPSPSLWWVYTPFFSGFGAVLGFFLVSGFSIAASISDRPEGFLARRAIRILPMYWFGMTLSLLLYVASGSWIYISSSGVSMPFPSLGQIFGNLLLMQGFLVSFYTCFGQTWSLSMECAYYLLAGIINRLNTASLFALFVASALIYIFACPFFEIQGMSYGITAAGLIWAWIAGLAMYKYRDRWWLGAIMAALSVIVVTIYNAAPDYKTWEIVALTIAVIYVAQTVRIPRPMRKPLGFLGDISWPLYITHLQIMCILNALGITNSYGLLAAAFIGAALSHFAVERPIARAIKNRSAQRLVRAQAYGAS
jgi:peptidoglycan/LPS O-acetylase OafA/YrhL